MNSRLAALVFPPVLALMGAVAYIEYRTTGAERQVADFCASIEAGLPARDFVERALARELDVHDFGVDSSTVVAALKVYGWQEEVFECRGEQDSAGKVRATRTERRALAPWSGGLKKKSPEGTAFGAINEPPRGGCGKAARAMTADCAAREGRAVEAAVTVCRHLRWPGNLNHPD
jgi:hypothetical protein